MTVVIAGSRGFIGTALVSHLQSTGVPVRRLVRGPTEGADTASWDPDSGKLDPCVLEGTDAVINLAGVGVGDQRWTPEYKELIRSSRLNTTNLIAQTLANMDNPPRVWVQASAVGFYGDRGSERLTESSAKGTGFLADVVQDWEAATGPAEQAVRVVKIRSGIVVAPDGGAFGRLLPLIKLGLGGRLGSGAQYWSWITLTDELRAISYLLETPVYGQVNLVAPQQATNAEVVAAMASALRRPALLPAPEAALRIGLGEFASELLDSHRVVPEVLTASGFRYTHPDLTEATSWLNGQEPVGAPVRQ